MGSIGGKTPIEQFPYSSLTLGILNKIRLMLCDLFNYVMGDKINRLSMSIAFKYIWFKGLNCLTNGRIVYLYIMYHSLLDYDYHLPKIGCTLFSLIG
jgi:hypothetical protein